MADVATKDERERLSDAYELRFKGEGGPLSAALFGAYLLGLLGVVYGSVLSHYVFDTYPADKRWIVHNPLLSIAAVIVILCCMAGAAFLAGRTRGPVLPEPGQIEFIVATDLPRRLALRDSWRGAQLVVIATLTCLGVAVPAGLALSGGPGIGVLIGCVLGLLGGIVIVQCWLRGQVRGHGPIGGFATGPMLDSLPHQELLTQSLMSEAVTTALVAADTRRARAQAFSLKLRRRPERIRIAGRYFTVVIADVYGLLRTGVSSLVWLVAAIVTVGVASSASILHAKSVLLLPVLLLLVHLSASGLVRGLQSQASAAGEQSLLGLPWRVESALHLAPLLVLQFVVSLLVGLITGVGALAVVHALALVLLIAGSQLLYAHKGPPPPGLMMNGPGRGVGFLWAIHPALVVLAAGFAFGLGAETAVIVGAIVLWLGHTRAMARFAPAKLRDSMLS
ncbi:hypothetical protein [Rudaeicoccus suwonensis]|uniref:ABC-2 type transport system permease protein n=1 Tax=Rudaeicoccus suwonensis TaxID=657409 RepID=A0A561E4A4_9MICO|nr:hypothetical protein [Rudaeicoccus suwonensis]TWE10445.1 hypothetical protein BKA23_2806 [Rudaeicoccus suwonensis]